MPRRQRPGGLQHEEAPAYVNDCGEKFKKGGLGGAKGPSPRERSLVNVPL